MADSWQITCINKTNRYDPHDRIDRVGGPAGGGWTLTVDQVISHIKNGNSFWVNVNNDRVKVIIARKNGREYIKTENDGDQPNNLLSLPECR